MLWMDGVDFLWRIRGRWCWCTRLCFAVRGSLPLGVIVGLIDRSGDGLGPSLKEWRRLATIGVLMFAVKYGELFWA